MKKDKKSALKVTISSQGWFFVCSSILGLASGLANAAVLTQTRLTDFSVQGLNVDSYFSISNTKALPFSQFDSSLGTLTGVSVNYTGTGNASFNSRNEPLTISSSPRFIMTTGGSSVTDARSFVTRVPATTASTSFPDLAASLSFSGAGLTPFSGINAVNVNQQIVFSGGLDNRCNVFGLYCDGSVFADMGGEVSIEYEFTPASASQLSWTQIRSVSNSVSQTNADPSFAIANNKVIPFSRFDPALGTLTAVIATLSGSGKARFDTGNSHDKLTIASTVEYGINVEGNTGGEIRSFAQGYASGSGQTNFSGLAASVSLSGSDLMAFIGTDQLDVQQSLDFMGDFSSLNQCGGSWLYLSCDPFVLADFNGDIELQYLFAANAVPVPAAIWLFISGLFGMAGWRRISE